MGLKGASIFHPLRLLHTQSHTQFTPRTTAQMPSRGTYLSKPMTPIPFHRVVSPVHRRTSTRSQKPAPAPQPSGSRSGKTPVAQSKIPVLGSRPKPSEVQDNSKLLGRLQGPAGSTPVAKLRTKPQEASSIEYAIEPRELIVGNINAAFNV